MFRTKKRLKAEVDELQLQKEMLQGLLQEERAASRSLRKQMRTMEVAHKELRDNYRALKNAPVPDVLRKEVSE